VPSYIFDFQHGIVASKGGCSATVSSVGAMGGKQDGTGKQTMLFYLDKGIKLPSFFIEPETLMDKLEGAMGEQDIDFVDDPEFSKKYRLQGKDETATIQLFSEKVRKLFVSHPGLCVEGADGVIMVCRLGKLVEPEGLGEFVEEGLQVKKILTNL